MSAAGVSTSSEVRGLYDRVDVGGGLLGEHRPGVKHHRQAGVRGPGSPARSAPFGVAERHIQGGAAGQCGGIPRLRARETASRRRSRRIAAFYPRHMPRSSRSGSRRRRLVKREQALARALVAAAIQTIGIILFLVGVVWLVIDLVQSRRRRDAVVREEPVVRERRVY